MAHLEKHGILFDCQHGFRRRRSCDTQLLLTYHDLASTVDNRGQVDMLVLDFAKAFDTVPHQRLLSKADHYGIRGTTQSWIAAFLRNRTQRVVIDGSYSAPAPVKSGVPQGTVLGPTLFLIYINDLATSVNSTVRLFADDCVMYHPIKNAKDCAQLQADLDLLHEWENKWLMRFNAKKCYVLQVTHKRTVIQHQYMLGTTPLNNIDSTGYLGVELSKDLKWNIHTNKTAAKGNRTLGVLRRNLGRCPQSIKDLAYRTILRPQLEFATAVWDPYTEKNIHKLESTQRRAARFVCNKYSYEASVTSMLHKLKWPTLEQRRAESRLSMMHRIVNNKVDIPEEHLFTRATRATRRSHSHHFHTIRATKDCFKNSFAPRTVIQWNNLPGDTVSIEDTTQFRQRISVIDLTHEGTTYSY